MSKEKSDIDSNESIFVGETSKPRFSKKLQKLNAYKLIVPATILLVVVAALIGTTTYLNSGMECKSGANNKLYSKSVSAMLANDGNQSLKKIVNTINSKQNNETVTECLYPKVVYSLNTNDIKKAEEGYNKLLKLNPVNQALPKPYGKKELLDMKEMADMLAKNHFFNESANDATYIQTVK